MSISAGLKLVPEVPQIGQRAKRRAWQFGHVGQSLMGRLSGSLRVRAENLRRNRTRLAATSKVTEHRPIGSFVSSCLGGQRRVLKDLPGAASTGRPVFLVWPCSHKSYVIGGEGVPGRCLELGTSLAFGAAACAQRTTNRRS